MILGAFEKCPICSRAGGSNNWRKINYNGNWWERKCSGYHTHCRFSQRYRKSFDDSTLIYFRFGLKDFDCYTYSEAYAKSIVFRFPNKSIVAGTYFYHKEYSRNSLVQELFQIWPDYYPDWDNLGKLNNKLNLLKTFQ